jgi:hypothetical protein
MAVGHSSLLQYLLSIPIVTEMKFLKWNHVSFGHLLTSLRKMQLRFFCMVVQLNHLDLFIAELCLFSILWIYQYLFIHLFPHKDLQSLAKTLWAVFLKKELCVFMVMIGMLYNLCNNTDYRIYQGKIETWHWPGTVTQDCNPKYTGGGDQSDCGSRPV